MDEEEEVDVDVDVAEAVVAGERKMSKNRPVNLTRSLRTIIPNQCKHDSMALPSKYFSKKQLVLRITLVRSLT